MALHKINDRVIVTYPKTGQSVYGIAKKVIEEAHGNQEARYLVQFEGTNDDKIFKDSEMRRA